MRKVLALMPLLLLGAATAHAQRFEGVITMHINAGAMPLGALGAGRGDAGPARGNGGARGQDGRGADGRGGRAFPNNARGGRGDAQNGRGDGTSAGAMPETNGRGGMPTEIEYMTRRGKVRIALGGMAGAASPGAVIYDPAEGQIYMLFTAGSMYMQTSFDSFAPPPDTMPGAITRREAIRRAPVVVHTKKFDLIAEHRCEHVLVTIAKQQTDVCMAKGLGTFVLPTGMGRAEAWQSVLTESNGFPLKVIGPDGRVAVEVTKVERRALPASLFSVPDSYTRMPDRGRPPG